MFERKRTYGIGKLEGKRGQSSRVQDLQGTMASTSYSIGEDDDNNLEEAQPGSLLQHKKARRYVDEIEEISCEIHILPERNIDYYIEKFEGKRVQSSTV